VTAPTPRAAPFGPAALGRGAVVRPGQPTPADLPPDAPRHRVDAATLATPGPVVDALHLAWVRRQPVVVELALDPSALRRPEVSTDPVHAHPADHLFATERLRHLVWANTVDCRGDRPTWWHTTKAVRATATAGGPGGGLSAGGPADVLLADGSPAWIDGGPRAPLDLAGDPSAVLHRDDTERGVIAPQRRRRPAGGAEGLAPDQAAAVNAALGTVRVAAPAGSGKTRVLTARLREIVVDRGTPADAVLALAYNTRAAAELRQRVGVPGVRVATVHAYALQVLRRAVGDLTVLDERQVRGLLSEIVEVPRRANADPLQPYLDALERVRTALVDPAVVDAESEDVTDLPDVLTRYRAALRRRRAVDFPEMVYRALEVLLSDADARQAEQARVGQVLVDEFQDLTPAYLLLIRLLASPQLQCFGVGDDDQVIYGHAGATPQHLLDFGRLFPGAEDHPLEVNYRCPAPVVEGAVRLLGHNAARLDKRIRPADDARATPITTHRVHTTEQATTAGQAVADLLAAVGGDPDGIAVLARVRVALLGTQADLASRGIPTRSPLGEWLLDRTGVRAALAYLRLATDDRMAGADLAEVLHRPLRPIPGAVRDTLRPRAWTTDQLRDGPAAQLGGRAGRALADLARDLDALRARARRQPTTELLRHISDGIGLGDAAAQLDASAGSESGAAVAGSHLDDLDALVQVADHCPDRPAVTLSTIHSVKGLEWPHVVVVGAAEGIIPHRLATSPAAVEEERRVFHVAMTRARSSLTIVAPRTGTSRFVAEALGEPSPLATAAAPRPTAGAGAPRPTGASRPSRRRTAAAGAGARTAGAGRSAGAADTRFRAAAGLQVRASGGLSGTIESVTDDGALVRTARGSLLRIRFGSEIRVEGTFGTLVRP
jgi:DNA helicase II / ATP-dependent DNA helicase PcrA